jgi:UDP-N-acetyl-D-galactosamine dehydrogenase
MPGNHLRIEVRVRTERPQSVAVVGLGYVGLSLAVALARHFEVFGVDNDALRVSQLAEGNDRNSMFPAGALTQPTLHLSTDPDPLRAAEVVIIAVPTPVDETNVPDLTALQSACTVVGSRLERGAIVVFESTVYPGCTEEECVPWLEQASGLAAHRDFGVGYSPERIDPGDRGHDLASVVKVVSAGDPESLAVLAGMYGEVVPAGIHQAPNIRTAEAAKVIENVQRDLNIALMNELSILFHKMDINTVDVLAAAGTKWNFARLQPGLVGGHCIPVDPYYLVHKARQLGYEPRVILAGREVNDAMARYVAEQTAELLHARDGSPGQVQRVLVMGLTFKADVRDTRNAQALVLVAELEGRGFDVWVSDPLVSPKAHRGRYLDDPFTTPERFDAVVLAVPHESYRKRSVDAFIGLLDNNADRRAFVDLHSVLQATEFQLAGVAYWSL